ncbi:MAG TPA: CapA family protein [Nitrospiraceae bacterium]|jgi:poly-gamma-glutamate capsule biosynthesis protein CapA/YwtB (metallophosphatase superfamily)|nr:CapA family protein [Nitrospiraceae bacterium]
MRIALAGDVMLGRLVDESVIRNPVRSPVAIWGDVLPVMWAADYRLINLECVISARGRPWHPFTKAFHFRAHPRAIEFLQAAKIDCVTLANNHVLDYGTDALLDCLALLDRAGIARCGAGLNLNEASAPAWLHSPQGRLAVVAVTDNEPDWEAGPENPGVHVIAYDRRGLLEPHRSRLTDVLARAREQADFVIVSAHVGPNWGAPSAAMRALAQEVVSLGADFYWGHSNHTPQGIELFHGRVILYSAGDFIDDYAVDPEERNDLSFLFSVEVERSRATRIRLHPVRIEDFGVRLARGNEAELVSGRMRAKCAVFGTVVEFQNGVGTIMVG